MEYHKQLSMLADNEFLERVLIPLSVGPVDFLLAGSSFPLDGNYLQVAEDHAEILETFREKTLKEARRVMEAKLSAWHELQMANLHQHRI